jgi:hypothetical protein
MPVVETIRSTGSTTLEAITEALNQRGVRAGRQVERIVRVKFAFACAQVRTDAIPRIAFIDGKYYVVICTKAQRPIHTYRAERCRTHRQNRFGPICVGHLSDPVA